MATARRNNTAMVLGVVRRNRRSLMTGTALQATVMLVLALPAQAQPAPNARPAGGTVVAGAATISHTSSNTQIDQATQRAAINWRSFDVGSQQGVTFNQPSASAVALNRVTGPDPSQIAGRINANGQFILVNQSGVNFYKGAQVNAAGVMVSAANITNQNFMAGVMKFDKAGNPNAKIDNQGTITVQQAGLAALVAPQVANSGTISAKLGHVVLAGAKTATLDLFGDGLLSLDVSNQVMQAPMGKDGRAATALVTNTGVIIADGGTVQLTARAADGIVQNLVQAGGTIRAATMGDQTGVVALNGVGGSIVVEGQLSAPGSAPGTKGGAIEIASNRNLLVAASAKIDASGASGGGVAAIGTTLARGKGRQGVTPTLTAASTVIRPGAKITADATNKGDGGRVTVLSTKATDTAGAITAKGGPQGGNGGFVEVSGDAGFSLTGTVDASAPMGALGSILLDPQDLFISATNPDNGSGLITPSLTGVPADGLPNATTNSWITPASIAGLNGAVTIATTRDLTVMSPLDTTKSGITTLTLNAGNDLTVNPGANITTAGSMLLTAGSITPTGALTLNSPISSVAGSIFLQAQTGNINQNAAVTANGPDQLVSLRTDGTVQFGASKASSGAQIQASGGTIEFGPTTDNTFVVDGGFIHDFVALSYRIGQTTEPFTKNAGPKASTVNLGDIGAGGGTMSFTNIATIDLQAHGAITETVLTVTNLNQTGLTLTGSGGPVNLGSAGNSFTKLGKFAANGDFTLTNNSALDITGAVNAGTGAVTLQIAGGLTETGGTITAATLTGRAATATLDAANLIANLGSFTAPGGLSLTATSSLNIAGPVNVGAGVLTLQIGGAVTESGGTITAGTVTGSSVGTFSLTNPANAIVRSSGITAANGDVILVDGSNLLLTGEHSGNNLFFEVAKAGGTLTLGDLDVGPAALATTGNGRISLVADNYVVTNVPNSITTTGGTVELAPFSPINVSLLGTGGLVVEPTLLPIIHTNGGTLAVGGFTNVPAGATVPAAQAVSVTIDGAVDLTNVATTLRLDATGAITEPGGSLKVTTLTGTAGSATLDNPNNQITNLGSFTAGGVEQTGALLLVDNGPLNVTGQVSAETIGLTVGGGLQIIGTPGTPGSLNATTVALTATGPITEPNGSITAGSFTAAAAGDVLLTSVDNKIAASTGITSANGSVVLVDDPTLLLTGTYSGANLFFEVTLPGGSMAVGDEAPAILTATGPGGRISLIADAMTATAQSAINAQGGTVELAPFSAINTSLLGSGGLGIDATLLSIIHTGSGTLDVGGFTNVPAGKTTPAASANSVTIDKAADLTGIASTLRLDSTGSITEPGGSLTVANLTGSAGTFASLTQPGNQIDTLGAFSTTAGFALVNNKSLLVAGPVTDTGGASTLALTTRTGDITLAGNVSATNVVNLIAAGAINQTSGSLAAATLTGSAATFASLTQPANLIGTLGAFSTGAGFALVNNKSLVVGGPVQDTGGASTLALTTRTGDITLAGNVSATNVVDLNSAGAIIQTGGSLVASTLTGSAGSSAGATLTSDNAISFLGPFTATLGVIDLVNSVPLTINGALTARLIFITATGSISLAGDITTGGLAGFTTVPTDPLASLGGAFFIVLPDASGNSSFAANSNVASLDGTGTVMFVSMPPQDGNVGLTNLNAPDTELLLNLGSGNASGQVNVGSLFVLGAGGQVNFTNSTVQGFTGSAAALAAQSFPPANPAYLVNGCEIGVGCIIVPPQPPEPPPLPPPAPPINPGQLAQGVSVSSGISNIVSSLIQNTNVAPIQSTQETNPRGVPVLNPMRDLSGGPLRDRQSDPDLLLPNVSEKDY